MASDGEDLPSFSAAEQLALNAVVEELVDEQNVPGAVAGLWINGRGAWTHATGIGDLETADPITVDDHFRIASVTKAFVAAILQLVDEGKLSLKDTLEPFVPGIANGDEITIRQLLEMTAGIFNFIHDPDFDREYTSNPLADVTSEDDRHHPPLPGPIFPRTSVCSTPIPTTCCWAQFLSRSPG